MEIKDHPPFINAPMYATGRAFGYKIYFILINYSIDLRIS